MSIQTVASANLFRGLRVATIEEFALLVEPIAMNDSLQGYFLIASPHLPDPNFFRTVVLIIHHDDEGAFGLILNRPLEQTIAEVWDLVADSECRCRQPINLGGPVDGQLMALHCNPEAAERPVVPGVYFSLESEELEQIVQQPKGPFRMFSGYAGWGAGQLESEMQVGGWLTLPATRELIFADQEKLWKLATERVGLEILAPMLKSAPLPEDPSCN